MNVIVVRCLRVLLLAVSLITWSHPVRAAGPDDPPLEIIPLPDLDKNLFLLQALEHTYASWPTVNADPRSLQEWIISTRLRMTRLEKSADVDNLDKDVIGLYKDALELLDQYEKFLTQLGVMNVNAKVQAGGAGVDLWNAASRGVEVGKLVGAFGEPVSAVVTGIVATVGSGLYDRFRNLNGGKELDEATKRFLDDEATRVNGHFTAALAGAETVSEKKRDYYKWTDVPTFVAGDLAKIAELVQRRPGDPFVIVRGSTRIAADVGAADLKTWSRLCLDAARRVPEGKVFDVYRAGFLSRAGALANSAGLKELHDQGFVLPAPSAGESVRINRTARALLGEANVPDDLRYQHGASLMYSGRFPEAHREMAEATSLHLVPGFAYDFACVFSRIGETKRALEWLEFSFKQGRLRSGWEDQDPDLDAARVAHPAEFKKIVSPWSTFQITWNRILGDTVQFTNTSLFPLTNLTMKMRVTSTGYPDYNHEFFVSYLAPDASTKWDANITSRGEDAKVETPFDCDQLKVPGTTTPGPSLHLGDGDYRAGPKTIRFSFGTQLMDPAPGKSVPPDDAVRQFALGFTTKPHVANSAFFCRALEPGVLIVLRGTNVTDDQGCYSFVYRAPDQSWHCGAAEAEWKINWQDLGKGGLSSYTWNFPGCEIHHDVVRPNAQALDNDREVDYRFRVFPPRL